MRRLVALVLALGALSSGGALAVTASAAPSTGAISGVVTNSSDTPVAGSSVIVFEGGGAAVAGSAITASDGTYTVGSLASGTYTVSFEPPPPGYGSPPTPGQQTGPDADNYLAQNYDGKSTAAGADSVVVITGATTKGINASLETGGAISGLVLDSSGKPVAGISVAVFDSDGASSVDGTTSAADGSYSVDRLPTGLYAVQFASYAGQNDLPEYLGGTSSLAGAYGVAVTAGSATSGVDVHLSPGGEIAGKVADASDSALANIDVTVYDASGDTAGNASTATDGTYAVGALPSGSYKVQFSSSGDPFSALPNYLTQFFDGASSISSATAVTVTAGATTAAVDAQLSAGGEIEGTVTDTSNHPLANVGVTAYDADGTDVANATTASDGTYTLAALPTGDYRVGFAGAGLGIDTMNYLSGFYGGASLADAKAVPVTAGSAATAISVQLAGGATVSGTVTAPPGSELDDVDVVAYNAGGSIVSSVNANPITGVYKIVALAGGTYRIGFNTQCCLGNDLAPQYSGEQSSLASAQPVMVSAGGSATGVDAELQVGAVITGTATDAEGDPLSNVFVAAFDAAGNEVGATSTRPNGGYALVGLGTGTYRLEFGDGDVGTQVQSVYYGGATTLAQATGISTTAGATTSIATMQLTRVTGAISGTVSDGSGHALAGADVTVYGTDGEAVGPGGVSAADGSYAITGLPPGFYRVGATLNGFASQFYTGATSLSGAQEFYVPSAQTASGIDVALETLAASPPPQSPPPAGSGDSAPSQNTSPSASGDDSGGAVAASADLARVTGSTVSTQVTCEGAATSSCTISVALTTVETIRGGKVLAVSASAKDKTTKRTVMIGREIVTVAGGQSKRVVVALNSTGRKLLSSVRRLPVTLTCRMGTTSLFTQALTLKLAVKKPKAR